MQKEETLLLKGIAILLMLWLHLFSDVDQVRQCQYLLPFFGGKPLAYAFTRIASCCVPIYIFLGGYGLACVFNQRCGGPMHNGRRALSLMVNFWVVCLLFIPLGSIARPDFYPGSLLTLVLNMTGIDYSYNGAWWFLLPYVVLTLCSTPVIRRFMTNSLRQDVVSLVVLLLVYITTYLAKDIDIAEGSPLRIFYTVVNTLYMLFPFAIGILFVKYKLMERTRQWFSTFRPSLLIAGLLLLCLVKMLMGSSALLHIPFVVVVLPLLLSVHRPAWLNSTLQFFGRHSTNLWLTHFFFCRYIFGALIYHLSYPLLIFAVLILVSLLSSYIIQTLYAPLRHRIRR